MRLAILSDIHGNLVALETVLADIRARAADIVVNLGDCVTGPLWPRETLELLDTLHLPTVRGNHDRWIAEMPPDKVSRSVSFTHDELADAQRERLGRLPPSMEVERGILAVHGTPDSDTDYLLEDAVDGRLAMVTATVLERRLTGHDATLVLCGHSHHQHMAFVGNRLVLNPGSVGCPRYADNEDPFIAEAGSPYAHYAIATRRGAGWSIEMLALDYDRQHVVQRARSTGRSDWVSGFLKGMVAL